MTPRGTIWIVASAVIVLTSMDAIAQAPNWHWSTFDKQASACACHLFARQALAHEQMAILQDAGSVVLGGNNQVIAEVVCMPNGRQVTVSTFSADFSAAERARNDIRGHILGAVLLDTCP